MIDIFSSKKISSFETTVGEQLAQAREASGLQISEIAKRLKIRQTYLEALEAGDRRRLPKGVYARNFLREYSRFLKLDYRSLLKQFSDEEGSSQPATDALFEHQVVAKRHLIAVPVVIRNLIIGLVAGFCLIYLGVLIKHIFQPPLLSLEQPAIDMAVKDRQLPIRGRTDPETDVEINGQNVQVRADGSFSEDVYLEQGLNTITIVAKKKYSRSASVVRHILFEETPPSLNSAN